MNAITRVLLIGASGRMGQAVVAAAKTEEAVLLAPHHGERDSDPGQQMGGCDVVIDFSAASFTAKVCAACRERKRPLVIGTTGHTEAERAIISHAALEVPIVMSPNFSIGVNVLFWLTKKAAELLPEDFDLEIVESHHRLKKDAPSGTAKRLAQILAKVRQFEGAKDIAHGREGLVGERPRREIGMHAIRAGDIVGEHTVILAGGGERVELTHRASSRETFARGALHAARWVVDQPAGLYSMEDVLGLRSAG